MLGNSRIISILVMKAMTLDTAMKGRVGNSAERQAAPRLVQQDNGSLAEQLKITVTKDVFSD